MLRANALGDYLFCVPALDALRAAYPRAEIVLLGAPWHARFLTGRPGPVDRVLVVPALEGIRAAGPDDPVPASDADEFLAKARAERFDLALQLHGGGRNSNPLVTALGARVTAGSRAHDAPPLDRWVRYTLFQPEISRFLEVVALVGAEPVTDRVRVAVTAEDEAAADAVLTSARPPVVALHSGANDPRRRWAPDRFAAVGDAAASAGAEVVVTGTAGERDVVEAVVRRMRAPARGLVDAVPLGGLAALYTRCAVLVSNDTGPLHLATAVGTPTVGLYWVPNLVNSAPPARHHHRALVSWTARCPVCGGDVHPRRTGCDHTASLLDDIPVTEVVRELLDLLDGAVSGGAGARAACSRPR